MAGLAGFSGAAHAASCCIPHSGTGCSDGSVQSCVCNMDPYCCNNKWDGLCASEADQCGSCTGDCCASNGSPGCDDEGVEVCVCDMDGFCCDVTWDGICANEAADDCGADCGGGNSCCEEHDGTGCSYGSCQSTVCNVDPYCCETKWDGICASEAEDMCPVCGGGPVCGDNSCNGSENCDSCPQDCGNCCGNGACEGNFGEDCNSCPEDCGSCSSDESCCLPHDSTGCKDGAVQNCVCNMDPYCCNNKWDSLCAAEADDCGSCNGDCCESNGSPGCDDESVEVCVCDMDPFCCNNTWDGLCANEASNDCGASCGPSCPDGQCNGGEDCNSCPEDCGGCCGNGACEAQFGEDCESCPEDCGNCQSNESCCLPHDTPGCADAAVQNCVCAMDGFCCNNHWDSICAGEADECGSCTGDCCASNGSPGCDEESVEVCVCDLDPFCCDVTWDNLCAGEAEDPCNAICCFPDCADKQCGPDGCGGSCGNCPPGFSCNGAGMCEQDCVPECWGKQ